jgi:novobiocin biosynthesis protein NovU/D-mycarose 3-C-methyltransferase
MPLANSFLHGVEEAAHEEKFPLDVHFCRSCSLVQLLDVVDREVLFRHYLYASGTSDTIAAHNRSYARAVTLTLDLGPSDLVVEIASNDGSLLRCFKPYGVKTLGVEPAANIAALARKAGVETLEVFFDRNAARLVRLAHGKARAVIANNVLAHVDDPRDFLSGCRDLIDDRGLVIVEVPELGPMLERLEYDTIYHEHLSYFSITSLVTLCDSVGLSVQRVERYPVHGGSVRIYAGRSDHHGPTPPDVVDLCNAEEAAGLRSSDRYKRFALEVASSRSSLLEMLRRLREEGHTVAGYGAPAKGNTLLNYCGIGTSLVPFLVDKSPLKVGLITPGMHIPVLPVNSILEKMPDYLLILAWNFADEIMSQQKEYAERGGRFIVPIPTPRIVGR